MKKKKKQKYRLHDEAEAFTALAAQSCEAPEEPPSPEELADFFANSKRFSQQRQDEILAYLDSCPQAYERWIRHGAASKPSGRTTFWVLVLPYATAACVVVLLVSAGLFWRGNSVRLKSAINRSYHAISAKSDSKSIYEAMDSLVHTLEQSRLQLGFSPARQLSPLAQAFKIGVHYNRQALQPEASNSGPLVNAQQEDYKLGSWYSLLWAVSKHSTELSTDFWKNQRTILNHFQTYYAKRAQEANEAEVKAVVLQLERLDPIFKQLIEDNLAVKVPYQQLGQILLALRYALFP